jgi:hypothetical protein
VLGWSALALIVLAVAVPAVVATWIHLATPGPPAQLLAMVEACEQRGEDCPDFLAKFRAFQQIYLADVEVARSFVPPDVQLLSLFGRTPAAVFVAEYTYLSYDDPPTPPAQSDGDGSDALYREVDVLLLAAKGPGGMIGAWASHVLVTHPKMRSGARDLGLPAELAPAGITVDHHCDPARSGIVFDVGPWPETAGSDRVRGIRVCLPHGPGQGSMNLKKLTNHTLPNLTGRIVPDKAYVYGAGPLPAAEQAGLTDFMLYLFTFRKAIIRLSSPIPQRVEGQGADSLAALLKGPRLPVATVFDGVESTVWDTLVRREGDWQRTKLRFETAP